MSINCPKCGIILGESDFDEDLGECDNCNKTFTVEQIIKEKDKEIAKKDKDLTELAFGANRVNVAYTELKNELKEKDFSINEFRMKMQGKEREIVELQEEITKFDNALSGFRMWLSAKNRENVLIDPDEVKGELEARIKESKETG